MPEMPAPDIQEADSLLPSSDYLTEASYLVSRGVRPLALVGHCPARPLVMLRVRTRLAMARYLFDTIPFVVPERDGGAAFGYAANRWVIDLLTWTLSDDVPPVRRHEILGLLLGDSDRAAPGGRRAMGARCCGGRRPVSDGLTLITIITASSREPGATAHSRAWRIPTTSAEAFAQAMTERYGQPIEGLSTVGAMQQRAGTNAADGFLFTDPEVPGA